jgi:hypothetical protein
MISDNNLEIKFLEDYVVIRTIDNIGFPVDVWRFKKDSLSKNERVFIDNMMSMAKSMTTDQDKNKKE